LARQGVLVLRYERPKIAVPITGVIKDHDRSACSRDAVENGLPVLEQMVGRRSIDFYREDVEVTQARRHLVSHDWRKVLPDRVFNGRGMVIDLAVVLRGNRQLDPFAGNGQDPLVEGGVAVTGMGERMDVRVATDI